MSEIGSELLFNLLHRKDSWVSGLGAATAQQALQMFHLDYEIIYVSGWQVASENNMGVNTYPDLSLYPSNSAPNFVKKINNTLLRRMTELDKKKLPPIIADGESGFGGIYNVYELTNQFIDSLVYNIGEHGNYINTNLDKEFDLEIFIGSRDVKTLNSKWSKYKSFEINYPKSWKDLLNPINFLNCFLYHVKKYFSLRY